MTTLLNKEKLKSIGIIIIPYLIIIAIALLSIYTLFFIGVPSGDDKEFHLSQIQDLYLGFTRGQFTLTTNHTFLGIFALDNFGYYGPFPHYAAASFQFLFSWAGVDTIGAYKTIICLSVIFSGIFAYWLAMEISHKNRKLSTIATAIYIAMPYQAFCGLCRQAYAETVAITFIPLVFYAAYRIVHEDKFKVMPYICLILGGSILILSHPFTALMALTFGVIYFLCNIKTIIKKKNLKIIGINLPISVLLTFFITSFFLFNAYTNQQTGLYNISNSDKMWTTLGHVVGSTQNSYSFSGFLNWYWISGEATLGPKMSSLIFGIILTIIESCVMILVDTLLKKTKLKNYLRFLIDAIALFILPSIIFQRAEIYIALAIEYVLFIFISIRLDQTKNNEETTEKLYKNPDLYYLIVMIILNLILIFVGNVWVIVPSLYYNCQFAWRLYSYLFFFVFLLITYLLVYYSSKKYTLLIGSVLACLTFASAMPTLEKRTYYEEGNYIQNVADEAWLKTVTQSGVQNEMTPQIYYDSEYTSEYANSLYYRVRYSLISHKQFVFDKSNYISPVFLYGEGNIKISELNTPYTKFKVNVTSDKALIQLPQFYYKGYVGEYTIDDLKFSLNGENIDCLLSFTLGKGEYDLEVNFIGNDGYRIMRPFLYIGIVSTIAYGVIATIYTKKKMKKAYKDI